MLKIKCENCGKSDVFENEKDAYLNGWYYSDGRGKNYQLRIQKAIEICPDCQRVAKDVVK